MGGGGGGESYEKSLPWGRYGYFLELHNVCLCQMKATMFIILQNVFAALISFKKWGILLRYSPVLAGVYSVT